MNRDELEKLMIDVLDGTADAGAIARLDAALEKDAVLRADFERARLACRALESQPLADLPADLRERIARAVRSEKAAPMEDTLPAAAQERHTTETPAGRRSPALRWTPALGFRVALPFAAGVAAGAVVVALATGLWRAPQAGSADVEGAMISRDRAATSTADLGGARMSLFHDERRATVLVETVDDGVSDAEMEFSPADFEASSIRWLRGPVGAVTAHQGKVKLRLHGRGVCEIRLRALSESPMALVVRWNGGSGSRQGTLDAGSYYARREGSSNGVRTKRK